MAVKRLASREPRYDPEPWKQKATKPLRHYLVRSRRAYYKAPADPMCDHIEGAVWWIVRSKRGLRALHAAFARQDVACCLFERVGAIVEYGTDERTGEQLLAMELLFLGGALDWDLDVSLSDAGLYVEEPWQEEE